MLLFDGQTRHGAAMRQFSRKVFVPQLPKTVRAWGTFGGATVTLHLTDKDSSYLLPLDDCVFAAPGAAMFLTGGTVIAEISNASATTAISLDIT